MATASLISGILIVFIGASLLLLHPGSIVATTVLLVAFMFGAAQIASSILISNLGRNSRH